LTKEEDIKIYVGRIWDPDTYTNEEKWASWEMYVKFAEKILIYKYSPNYNSLALANKPKLFPHESIRLMHQGKRNRLEKSDNVPDDL
jgi:hypothetical protein